MQKKSQVSKKGKGLTYDELMLGEKAVLMYKAGKGADEIAREAPVFLNTRDVVENLNVTDLAIAATLGGMNQLYAGGAGTGKSQLMYDIGNSYFGGNKGDGGNGVTVRGYHLTERTLGEMIFEKMNLDKAQWELTDNVEACLFGVDEVNRAPTIRQNDCFELGDGILNHGGRNIPFGRDGYHVMIATANLGNGDYQGTFEIDKALFSRMGVVIDFDYSGFEPTFENREFLNKLRSADSSIKRFESRDLSDKVIAASKEIAAGSLDLGLKAESVLRFLEYGLNNCSKKSREKNKKWYIQNQACQTCELNSGAPISFVLCSSVKGPVRRTIEATRRYISALDYLVRLKGEKVCNPRDLAFKAFELTGAYQDLLNPSQLKGKYFGECPEMMGDIVEELKTEYKKREDFILTTLEAAQKGVRPSSLYCVKSGGRLEGIGAGYEKVDSATLTKLKQKGKEVSREEFDFNDKGVLGYSWVKRSAECALEGEGNGK